MKQMGTKNMRRLEDKSFGDESVGKMVCIRYEMSVFTEDAEGINRRSSNAFGAISGEFKVNFGIEEYKEIASHFKDGFFVDSNPAEMKRSIDLGLTNLSGKEDRLLKISDGFQPMRTQREVGKAMRSLGWDRRVMKRTSEWGNGQYNTWYFKG